MSVQAVVVDPEAPNAMRIGEVAEPTGGPAKMLIEVHHVSLNHGDLNDARSGRIPPGGVLGSDAAGVVTDPARYGSGPAVGARVAVLAQGAFAERIAVGVDSVAEVPHAVHLAEAAALPVAGLAALRALRAAGPLLGRRVLITGASGGVGRFAVQLAPHAGAYVISSVGSLARGEGLGERGANEVVVGLDGLDQPVDVVLESVGGSQLVAAWRLLAPGATCRASAGPRGNRPSSLRTRRSARPSPSPRFRTRATPRRISPLLCGWWLTARSVSRSAGARRGSSSPRQSTCCAAGACRARRCSTCARDPCALSGRRDADPDPLRGCS
jgi:NADPH:quinone reductase